MASWDVCLLSLTLIFNITTQCGFAFVSLNCNDNKNGRSGQQSLLECIVVLSPEAPNVRIERVIWIKEGAKKALIEYERGSELKSEPRFTLPETHNNHLNVSMLVTDTMIADIGNYRCIVNTNRGLCSSSARLHLSAPYGTPKLYSTSNSPNQRVALTLFCTATGGYPEGKIRWFGEYGSEWTRSSRLSATKSTDGSFVLTSQLDLLTGSVFYRATCVVYNIKGDREGDAQYNVTDPKVPDPQSSLHEGKTAKSDLASKIVIPVVVIGSVIIGLLIVRLLKPHCQSSRQAIPTNNEYDYEGELQNETMPEGEYNSYVSLK